MGKGYSPSGKPVEKSVGGLNKLKLQMTYSYATRQELERIEGKE